MFTTKTYKRPMSFFPSSFSIEKEKHEIINKERKI